MQVSTVPAGQHPPPEGGDGSFAFQLCGGDSKTATPREPQKDKGRKTSGSQVELPTDLEHGKSKARTSGKRNALDLNSNAGLVLAIKLILRGKFNEVKSLLAVCCSSFVLVNRGTGKRDILVPEGDWTASHLACSCHWQDLHVGASLGI